MGKDEWQAAMRRGDTAAALAIHDVVLAGRDVTTRDDPRAPYHLRWVWDGRPMAGRRVLVRCYHGLGDTLQFARYLAPLRGRAAWVTLEAQAELVALLGGLADAVVAFDPSHPLPPDEVDVEIMELSHALRLPLDQVAPACLVRPGPFHVANTGLCWRAGGWDTARSIPLGLLQASVPGPWTSLQRGSAVAEAGEGFANPGDGDPDVVRTAALILGCDRVVTVDTMVAHLAGTLGVRTLLLLRHDPDWRWGAGDMAPGYPTVRLLRQAAAGDWSVPLSALALRTPAGSGR